MGWVLDASNVSPAMELAILFGGLGFLVIVVSIFAIVIEKWPNKRDK